MPFLGFSISYSDGYRSFSLKEFLICLEENKAYDIYLIYITITPDTLFFQLKNNDIFLTSP